MTFTSTYPRGLGIALLLVGAFLVLALDVKHLVCLAYGAVMALAHVSRASWHR